MLRHTESRPDPARADGLARDTVLVVDAQPLLREALCEVLEHQLGLTATAHTGDDQLAMRIAVQSRPRVIVVAVDHAGAIASRLVPLHALAPQSRLVVLSSLTDLSSVQEVLALNVSGYLTKDAGLAELVDVVRSVLADGGSRPSPRIEQPLSARELEVLARVAEGLSNRQIAMRMDIAEGTVKRHLHNAYTKLGAVSRIDAVNKALLAGPPHGYRRRPAASARKNPTDPQAVSSYRPNRADSSRSSSSSESSEL